MNAARMGATPRVASVAAAATLAIGGAAVVPAFVPDFASEAVAQTNKLRVAEGKNFSTGEFAIVDGKVALAHPVKIPDVSLFGEATFNNDRDTLEVANGTWRIVGSDAQDEFLVAFIPKDQGLFYGMPLKDAIYDTTELRLWGKRTSDGSRVYTGQEVSATPGRNFGLQTAVAGNDGRATFTIPEGASNIATTNDGVEIQGNNVTVDLQDQSSRVVTITYGTPADPTGASIMSGSQLIVFGDKALDKGATQTIRTADNKVVEEGKVHLVFREMERQPISANKTADPVYKAESPTRVTSNSIPGASLYFPTDGQPKDAKLSNNSKLSTDPVSYMSPQFLQFFPEDQAKRLSGDFSSQVMTKMEVPGEGTWQIVGVQGGPALQFTPAQGFKGHPTPPKVSYFWNTDMNSLSRGAENEDTFKKMYDKVMANRDLVVADYREKETPSPTSAVGEPTSREPAPSTSKQAEKSSTSAPATSKKEEPTTGKSSENKATTTEAPAPAPSTSKQAEKPSTSAPATSKKEEPTTSKSSGDKDKATTTKAPAPSTSKKTEQDKPSNGGGDTAPTKDIVTKTVKPIEDDPRGSASGSGTSGATNSEPSSRPVLPGQGQGGDTTNGGNVSGTQNRPSLPGQGSNDPVAGAGNGSAASGDTTRPALPGQNQNTAPADNASRESGDKDGQDGNAIVPIIEGGNGTGGNAAPGETDSGSRVSVVTDENGDATIVTEGQEDTAADNGGGRSVLARTGADMQFVIAMLMAVLAALGGTAFVRRRNEAQ